MIEQIAPILTACAALATPVGGGIVYVHRRFAALDRKWALCEQRDQLTTKKFDAISTGFVLLCDEMARVDPLNPTLTRVGALLRAKFPVDPRLPNDWAALMQALDGIAPAPAKEEI